MRILENLYAVFWRDSMYPKHQFHADVAGTSPADAVANFRAMYPRDTVCSVRDQRGRFLPFKESNHA